MEGNSKYAPQIKSLRKNYVRFPLDLKPEVLEQFRSACAANGTTPTTEIKRFIAEYCEQGGGFALRRPCKTKQPGRGRRDGRRSSRSEGARRG